LATAAGKFAVGAGGGLSGKTADQPPRRRLGRCQHLPGNGLCRLDAVGLALLPAREEHLAPDPLPDGGGDGLDSPRLLRLGRDA